MSASETNSPIQTINHPNSSIHSPRNSMESLNPNQILTFGARQIISLFVPVTICMSFVVLVACTVDFYSYTDQYLIYTPFHTPDADLGTRTWETIANTLIFISVIVVMTCILVLLFKYHCYKFIRGSLIMTTFFLLSLISFIFFSQVIRAMGIFVDYITLVFLLWNFGIVGMIAIHWRAPLVLQQAYLIFLSAQIALIFLKYLPKWTCWLVLAALAVWDLIAVLCPKGPLRILVEMAHERDQPLFPALLYSTTTVYLVAHKQSDSKDNPKSNEISNQIGTDPVGNESGDPNSQADEHVSLIQNPPPVTETSTNEPDNVLDLNQNTDRSDRIRNRSQNTINNQGETHGTGPSGRDQLDRLNQWRELQADLLDREERGVKLGLGDFVFYSLLIGRATLDGDAVTVLTCYVAILVGMCVTIIVLGIIRRPLPALPISIACGIIFYIASSTVISPFLQALSRERLFF